MESESYDAEAEARAWLDAPTVMRGGEPLSTFLLRAHAAGKREGIEEERTRLLGLDGPWPLDSVLAKLAEAAGILLGTHSYDGLGWEAIHHARQAAHRIRALLTHPESEETSDGE